VKTTKDNLRQRFQSHEAMTDEEMLEVVLKLPNAQTLWRVEGEYQRGFAEIPVPRRKVRARRKR
jgi:hypothetical protein